MRKKVGSGEASPHLHVAKGNAVTIGTCPIDSSGVARAIEDSTSDNQGRSVVPSGIASGADLLSGSSKENRRSDRILLSWTKTENITSTRGVEELVEAISESICWVRRDTI